MTDQELRVWLSKVRTIAVVGISDKPERPSHGVARYLQGAGYRVLPVNPLLAGQMVLGQACVARLQDLQEPVDIVDVFRKTEDVIPVAEEAVAIGAKALWQQLGIANAQADALARSAGLVSVMNRCLKVEHARVMRM